MKRPMGKALWSDCETDEERAEFFRSGRAYDTGVIAKDLAEPLALAFEDAAKWRQRVSDFEARWNDETRQFSIQNIGLTRDENVAVYLRQTAKPAPPWGPDAVPLMQCPSADKCTCPVCDHRERHVQNDWCLADIWGCPPCVQVGWRERSKP